MATLQQALRGAQHQPVAPHPLQALLVVGGGGALGSAVLAETLVAGRFSQVQALVAEPLSSSLRDFQPVPLVALESGSAALAPAAVIVLERQRRSNGRDDAFVQPAPQALLPLARQLQGCGVRRLLVVVPHAPAMLPQALAKGFASLEELALADLGFEHLVLLRASQTADGPAPGSGLQRLAHWWLSQLSWMVPQRQQPLRAASLARCVAHLARLLPALPPGSRVIAPETLWQWAQEEAGLEDALLREFGAARTAGHPPP